VASGLGVSVLPRDALTPRYHSQLVVPVPFTQPVPTRRIALAYRRSFPRPAAIEALHKSVLRCRARPAARKAGKAIR
ncbi:MAG TPA: LysR substrate-binding domain-containing protein, partial [Casimicrobiaceae bacterium]